MKRSFLVALVAMFMLAVHVNCSESAIFINEFLADPAVGLLGDANRDGVTSSSQDEFIEIVNFGDSEISLSNWYIEDNVGVKAVFGAGISLLPSECILVFGGGSPTGFDVQVVTASSGSLGLNNAGDSISLYDSIGSLVSSVSYGSEGGKDQSLSRYPDGIGGFELHSLIPDSGGALFSPGTRTNGHPFMDPVIPEPSTILMLGFSCMGYLLRLKKQEVSDV